MTSTIRYDGYHRIYIGLETSGHRQEAPENPCPGQWHVEVTGSIPVGSTSKNEGSASIGS
jgi:hypothetical protein